MGVRITVGVRGEANRDRHHGLIGYTATFPFGEHGQPSQNTSEQGIYNRTCGGGCGGPSMVRARMMGMLIFGAIISVNMTMIAVPSGSFGRHIMGVGMICKTSSSALKACM